MEKITHQDTTKTTITDIFSDKGAWCFNEAALVFEEKKYLYTFIEMYVQRFGEGRRILEYFNIMTSEKQINALNLLNKSNPNFFPILQEYVALIDIFNTYYTHDKMIVAALNTVVLGDESALLFFLICLLANIMKMEYKVSKIF